MAKLSPLQSLTDAYSSIGILNNNFQKITTALQNTLSRDGSTPNTMGAVLDMNSNRVINVANPVSNSDAVNKNYLELNYGVPVNIEEFSSALILANGSSTARSINDRFAERINVKDYGAIGDGLTNDRTAIQAAITRAIAINGCVYFPAGIYLVGSALTVSGSGTITLLGDGDVSEIRCTTSFTGNNILSVTSTGTVDICNLKFNGNYPTTTGMSTGETLGVLTLTGSGGIYTINSCTVVNGEANGIVAGTSVGSIEISNSIVNTMGDFGIRVTSQGGSIVSNNFVRNCGGGGIQINQYSFNSKDVTPSVVEGNWIENITDEYFPATGSRGNGIHLYNCTQVNVTGNYIRNCEWSAIRAASAEFININNNVCINSGETAIWCEFSHEYNQIVGNTVYIFNTRAWNSPAPTSASGPGISCVNLLSSLGRATLVANNTVVLGTSSGIYIEGDVHCVNNTIDSVPFGICSGTNQYQKDNFISGNKISDRATRAWANSTSYGKGDRVTVSGNVYLCVTGGTSDSVGTGPSGTSTGITDGTCVWDYMKVSFPLQVGICISKGSATQGFAYVTNNLILDATVATIAPFDGNPMTLSTWSTGSKVVMYNNMPGIVNTYLPASPNSTSGASLTYVTDTGDMKYYDAYGADGTNGKGWRNLKYLTGSTTWNPGSLVDGAGETSSAITVTGAAFGDYVIVAAPYDLQGITATAYVSAANTVRIRIQNETGSTIDLASGSWTVRVLKP